MIITQQDYLQAVMSMLNMQPLKVYLFSFGLYAGCDGLVYDVLTSLDSCARAGVQVHVAIALPKTPQERLLEDYSLLKGEYSCIRWKQKVACHIKGIAAVYKRKLARLSTYRACIGSRNLTASTWHEMDLLVAGKAAQDVFMHMQNLWKER